MATPVSRMFSLMLSASIATIMPQSRLAGTWTAELPQAVRTEDGVVSVESTTPGTLVLEMRGDSVFGTLMRGRGPTARPLRGKITDNKVVLVAQSLARVYADGGENTLALLTTFRLTLNGNAMTGTIETSRDPSSPPITLPGVEQPPLPVTVKRTAP
ncbi:MAG: hypothetical protein IT353_15360 [Gemmatimonadaceae bacterium]|nr:hypothetical protein [Gemmatimonadaceae bacterium]